jgi:hypothetical protein
MEMLRDVDANVVGIVANGWQPQNTVERNNYGYGYGYGDSTIYGNGKDHPEAVGLPK